MYIFKKKILQKVGIIVFFRGVAKYIQNVKANPFN